MSFTCPGSTVPVTEALVPQLVEASALRAAGIGPEGASCLLHAAEGVDVAQRQIVGAALLHVLQGHGPVAAVPDAHLSVEKQDAGQPLVLRVKRAGDPGGSPAGAVKAAPYTTQPY